MRVTLKKMWQESFADKLSYNTFRKYVDENIDEFKEIMIVKQNPKRKTMRILNKEDFITKFKELYWKGVKCQLKNIF